MTPVLSSPVLPWTLIVHTATLVADPVRGKHLQGEPSLARCRASRLSSAALRMRLRYLFFVATNVQPHGSNMQALLLAGLLILRFATFTGAATARETRRIIIVTPCAL